MTKEKRPGEGNREADRRYRKGVRETVEETTPGERAEKARDMSKEELKRVREAEDKGKSRARK